MSTEKLYYTDGHDVTVTSSALKVHHKVYRLAGIIRHNLTTISPSRMPGLLILLAGALIGFAGLAALFPINFLPAVQLMGKWATTNDYAIVLGGILLLAGLISLVIVKRKYAVHICTATEEEDIIVSKERAYIAQIVDGLNRAMVGREFAEL
jgi:Family of unknown function (DUF6232)